MYASSGNNRDALLTSCKNILRKLFPETPTRTLTSIVSLFIEHDLTQILPIVQGLGASPRAFEFVIHAFARDNKKAFECLDFMDDLLPPEAVKIARSLLLLLNEDYDELDSIGKMLNIDPPVAFKIFVVILMNKDQKIVGTLLDQVFRWIENTWSLT